MPELEISSSALEPPTLRHYDTWVDMSGFYARWKVPLPESALAVGCHQVIHAETARDLWQQAIHNRVRIWTRQVSGSGRNPSRADTPS
jgi:hypothetical protein